MSGRKDWPIVLAGLIAFIVVAPVFLVAARTLTRMAPAASPVPCPHAATFGLFPEGASPPGITTPVPCPGAEYSTFLGGSDIDKGWAMAADADGNMYLASTTFSSDFPTTSGALDTMYNGGGDVAITKLNATGAVVFSTYFGGSSAEEPFGLAVDELRNVYVTGITSSRDLPTTSGAYDRSYNGGNFDAFVAKISADGASLAWSTFLGGTGEDRGQSVAVDASGVPYVTGLANSRFPSTPGSFDPSLSAGGDGFVTKFNADASALVYSTFLGGNKLDWGRGVNVDANGNAYVTGITLSTGFPTTSGAFDRTHNGDRDVFVTKLNAAGSDLVYSTYLGGSGWDEIWSSIAVDSQGNAHVAGRTRSSDFPTTPGVVDVTFEGLWEAFVTKLNATGSALVYSTFLGGSGSDDAFGIGLGPAGDAYVVGRTDSTDFPVTAGAFDETYNGNVDAFMAKIDPAGSTLVYSTFIGGSDWDMAWGVGTDSLGTPHIAGETGSSDFPTTLGAYDGTYNGGARDSFAVRL